VRRPLSVFGLALLALSLAAQSGAAQVMRWGGRVEVPVEVPGSESIVQVDAGNANGYGVTSSGSVLAWGRGIDGALGRGSRKSSNAAVRVQLPAGVQVVSLGEAERSGFAVTSTGHVFDWGMNKHGDLCLGGAEGEEAEAAAVTTPREVPGVSEAVAVQGAKNHVLILLANGTVETCGWGPKGQLGLGKSISEVTSPQLVPGLSHVVEVSAGPQVSAARTASGEVLVFGSNIEGQVGMGGSSAPVFTPTRLALPGPASSISVGGGSPLAHTEALVNGVPYCWGSDLAGECGDGTERQKDVPTVASALATLGPLRSVKAAGLSTMALTASGDVYTVGGEGELGIPSGAASFLPQFVEGGVSEISATAEDHLELG